MPWHEVFHMPDFDPETEEICEDCRGEGRVVWIHYFIPPDEYRDCFTCQGSGKTIKRPKCIVEDCKKKCSIVRYPDFAPDQPMALDPSGLCTEHWHSAGRTRIDLEKLREEKQKNEQQKEELQRRIDELEAKQKAYKAADKKPKEASDSSMLGNYGGPEDVGYEFGGSDAGSQYCP